ncbi:hypothetical protein BTUL_0082g00560 [Botrytis tulipae]|uniref:Uncharacterized protein n=1 Tax=Botrytis tulipae TaxID=87230 RepID=A0A4Z1EMK3_9HELO|nr:hypothetical protein BTUL_0082g00560 [Botrytis tulipae]
MNVVVIARTSLGYLQLASIQNRDGLIHDVLFNLCANIIKIYSSSTNRIPIQHELGSATRIGSRDDLTSNHRCETMFPFIQTCLAVGFTSIPSIGYEAANNTISMKEFDPDLDRSQPYLVFDITNPKDIGYCFFHVDSFKWKSLDQLHAPRMTPLSANVFFAGGHHASKRRRIMTPYQNYDSYLDQFRVIDAYTLRDAWPHGIWMVLVGDTYDLLSNHPQVNQNHSVTGALSLQILAETKLFNELHLQTPANFRLLLDKASVMPNFFLKAISKSREKPLRLSRYYNSRELLGEALKTQSIIDLGHPYNLSSGHIFHILKKERKFPWPFKEGVYALSLREVNLTLPFLINGFANFLRVLSNPDTNRRHVAHGTRILAKTMAISEMNDEMKIAPIANNLSEFNLTRDEKKGDSWVNYARQKPRVAPSGKWNLMIVSQPYKQFPEAVKHSFRHRYAFIKAKEHDTHAEASAGQERTGSVAFIENYEPELVVNNIDQFFQQAVTGEEDDRIIEKARDFWKRGTASLDLQRCSEAEVKVIAKEAKLLFRTEDDNGRVMLKVLEQET